jgi:predicted transposase/invertase (TIGR01784 family)
LLRQKANFKVLEGFLSVLLKENILIESILESESNQEEFDDKFNEVDIVAINSNKEIMIIEVQVNAESDYFQRMLYGTSKILTEYMYCGDNYNKLRKVYSINIVYFDLSQGEDYKAVAGQKLQ